MEWPVCSPDMNPIEHVWDSLGRRVAGRQPPPQTLQELERVLEEWDRTPHFVINSHIESMPQRCSKNYHTHLEEEYANYKKPPDGADTFQCTNRMVMAQRKHFDDFLRGRIIGRLECGRTQLEVSEELGIAQSVVSRLWQRFEDDGNVSRCYITGRPRVTTPNDDRYLAVTAKRNRQSTASDLSRQLSSAPVRQFQGRLCTDAKGTLVYMLVGLSDVFGLPQLTVAWD
ncbi:uncharacterized protein TNCV_4393361 [Trichonephila clavipes]|nr:uncharacterized protein TNCV_4393361 [Trichonephila clavipes]